MNILYICMLIISVVANDEKAPIYFNTTINPKFPIMINSIVTIEIIQTESAIKARYSLIYLKYETDKFYEININRNRFVKTSKSPEFNIYNYTIEHNKVTIFIKCLSKYQGNLVEFVALKPIDRTQSEPITKFHMLIMPKDNQLILDLNITDGYMLMSDTLTVTCYWNDYAAYLQLIMKDLVNIYKRDSKVHIIGVYRPRSTGRNFTVKCSSQLYNTRIIKTLSIDVYNDENDYFWSVQFNKTFILNKIYSIVSIIITSFAVIYGFLEIICYVNKAK